MGALKKKSVLNLLKTKFNILKEAETLSRAQEIYAFVTLSNPFRITHNHLARFYCKNMNIAAFNQI